MYVKKSVIALTSFSYTIRKIGPIKGKNKKDTSGNIIKIPSPNYVGSKTNGFIVPYYLRGIRVELVMDNSYFQS